MKRIFLVSSEKDNGCAFYRGIGVLGELRRYDITFNVAGNYLSWSDLSDCDIGFIQRPFNKKHVEVAKAIKQQMPLWIDFDDDVFNVPPSNIGYELYHRQETIDSINQCLELADVVTVSTEGVKKSLGKGTVIPNAYNDYRLSTKFFSEVADKKVVLWRGTETHIADLQMCKKALDFWIEEHPEVHFCFYGFNPWFLEQRSNIFYIPAQDIYSYFHSLEIINPIATIVPLEDNKLNRAKSNIAWLETARFGGKCFAPSFEEWSSIPGVETFFTFKDFLESPFRKDSNAWNFVQNNLLLSKINQKRIDLINEYC